MTFAILDKTSPPCPTCGRMVDGIEAVGEPEPPRLLCSDATTDLSYSEPPPKVLVPCGHYVKSWIEDADGNVKRWEL